MCVGAWPIDDHGLAGAGACVGRRLHPAGLIHQVLRLLDGLGGARLVLVAPPRVLAFLAAAFLGAQVGLGAARDELRLLALFGFRDPFPMLRGDGQPLGAWQVAAGDGRLDRRVELAARLRGASGVPTVGAWPQVKSW